MPTINVDITKFDLDSPDSFWEMNPQFRYMIPYSDFYDYDKTKNHSYSSKAMWVIVFMLSPDDSENLFYRREFEERKESLERFHPTLDWENKHFKECYKKFPQDCLTVIEREMVKAEQTIKKRIELVNNSEWTLDKTEIVINGKSGQPTGVLVKGTSLQLNTLQKDLDKALQSLDKLKAKYDKSKIQTVGKGKIKITKGQDMSFWQN